MSAEEMYPERGATGRRLDDPYATRPLPLHEITDHPPICPLIGPPSAAAAPRAARHARGASVAVYLFLSLLVLRCSAPAVGCTTSIAATRARSIQMSPCRGSNVGELTPQEAEAALRARYGAFLQQPATLTYGDQTWQPGYARDRHQL